MANLTRRWTANEIEKLRRLAGKRSPAEIAAELSRTRGSLAVKAHELKISLRIKDTDAARPSAVESQSP
jgi:hypothetical protein